MMMSFIKVLVSVVLVSVVIRLSRNDLVSLVIVVV